MLLTLGLALTACTSAPDSDKAEVGDAKDVKEIDSEAMVLSVNTNQSIVEWVGTKTNGRHNGTVNIQSGTVAIQDDKIVGGEFAMDLTTLIALDQKMDQASNQKLTGHLKSGDFFKVDEFPTATFVITNVEASGTPINESEDTHEIDKYRVTNPTHTVNGNLTIRGITRGISFPARVEMTDNSVTSIAKFNINRKDWDLKWEYPPGEVVLNNTIHLGINLIATKPAA